MRKGKGNIHSSILTRRPPPAHQFNTERCQRDSEAYERSIYPSASTSSPERGIAYKGVGFPNVFRRSPLTAFCGLRYNFSNNSGEMLRLSVRLRGAPFPFWWLLPEMGAALGFWSSDILFAEALIVLVDR